MSETFTEREQAVELLNRFGITIDQRDWDSYANLFADSVEFDYSAIGNVSGTFSAEEITQNARGFFGSLDATQHVITNHQISLGAEGCNFQVYVRAMHFLEKAQGEPWFEIGGYYEGMLTKKEKNWKISRWKFSVYWSRGNENLFKVAE